MKRFLQVSILVLLMALMSLTVVACGGSSSAGTVTGTRQEYTGTDVKYDTNWQKAYCDRVGYTTTGEGVTVDGVLDDVKWNEVYGLTYSAYTATVTMKTFFGQDGMYVAYEIKDNNVWQNDLRSLEHNTSAEVLIAPYDANDQVAKFGTLQLRLGMSPYITILEGNGGTTGAYSWSNREKPVYGGYKVHGEVNTGRAEGLDLELFVGWDSLGYERDSETGEFNVPTKVKMYSQYNYATNDVASSQRLDYIRPYAFYSQPRTWYYFDAKGYINNDERIEAEAKIKTDNESTTVVMGDSYTGLPKTWAWDLSDAGNGVYKTTNTCETQRLFVKDGYAKNYVFSATVNRIGQSLDKAGRAHIGLIAMNEKSGIVPTSALVAGGGDASNGKITNYKVSSVKYTQGTYHTMIGDSGSFIDSENKDWVSPAELGNLSTFGDKSVKLTMVKYGANFAYFVNDVFWKSVTNVELADEACPGFVAHNVDAKFTNVSYSTDEGEIAAALANANLYVASITQSHGGTVTATVYNGNTKIGTFTDTMLVKRGYSIIYEIKTSSSGFATYTLDKFTINGEEVTVSNNKYTISNVTGTVTAVPTYKQN